MAIRNTTLILKNSDIVNRPLPSSLYAGEPIVNTADGIVYFSGVTTSTSEWTPAGTGATELTFFEVGSNLYDLRLRNKITKYDNVSGGGLVGKFLSGTTNGFVLADISNISPTGVTDTYVTGYTYTPNTNTFTIKQNQGQPDLTATFDSVSGLTVNGDLTVTGNTSVQSLSANTLNITSSPSLNNSNTQFLTRNTSSGDVEVTSLSAITSLDTFVTGYTYSPNTNTFTIKQNQGQPDLTSSFDTVSGLTVSNDLTVMGDLTVFGAAISAFTSQLYVEDPNVIFNYNPTGSTTLTSVNAGVTIQDGNGISGNSVNLDIVRMQNLTGLTSTEIPNVSEYTGLTGYENRGWITQLHDIVIRSTDITDGGSPGDITGVRVLGEFDVLDSGQY